MVWLPDGEKNLEDMLYSFPQNTRMWQIDRWTPNDGIGCAYLCRHTTN